MLRVMQRRNSPRSPRRPRALARAGAARRSAGHPPPLTLSNLRTLRWMSPEVVTARRNDGGGIVIFLLGATGDDKEGAVRALARGARRPVSRIDVGRLFTVETQAEPRGLPGAFALARRIRSLMVLDGADALFGPTGSRTDKYMSHKRLWHLVETYPGTVIIATEVRPPLCTTRADRHMKTG